METEISLFRNGIVITRESQTVHENFGDFSGVQPKALSLVFDLRRMLSRVSRFHRGAKFSIHPRCVGIERRGQVRIAHQSKSSRVTPKTSPQKGLSGAQMLAIFSGLERLKDVNQEWDLLIRSETAQPRAYIARVSCCPVRHKSQKKEVSLRGRSIWNMAHHRSAFVVAHAHAPTKKNWVSAWGKVRCT